MNGANPNRRKNRPRSLRWWITWIAITQLCGVSCSLTVGNWQGPQYWESAHGPAVPHDNFPTDCSLCHEGGGWHAIRADFEFDHAAETGVPLVGAHQHAKCLRCHNDRGPVAVFANRGCAGCHDDIHRGQLGKQCLNCHNQTDWIPQGQIALHARTRFPLTGAHTGVACFRCHPGAEVGNLIRAPVECVACHQNDLQRATSPNHIAQGWTQNCQQCHTPVAWTPAGFTHAGITSNCVQCHQADYNAATNPNHASAGFSTSCQNCHNTTDWHMAMFSHAGITTNCVQCHVADYNGATNPNHVAQGFSTSCEDCHNTTDWHGGGFTHAGITTNCVQCHQADYNGATSPNHVAMGFPTACESCHNTTDWHAAMFNHAGISTNCVQCHQSDYNTATSPNHLAAGYPTSCETCHNTADWHAATFNHVFRITSGPHQAYTCAECHQTPSNYNIVSCTHCHAHRQSEANSEHSGVSGYIWSSPACVNCHPTGQ